MKKLLAVCCIRMVFLLTIILLCANAISFAQTVVCGLNAKSGMERVPFWQLRGRGNRSVNDQMTMVNLMNGCGLWPLLTPDNRSKGLTQPTVKMTIGGKNAIVYEETWARTPNNRTTTVLVDDDWLEELVRLTGTTWARTVILAHELGHIYEGDLFGRGMSTVWLRERQADYFAGWALSRLGASLRDAQAAFYYFAAENDEESDDEHPSLRFRLESVEDGWNDAKR